MTRGRVVLSSLSISELLLLLTSKPHAHPLILPLTLMQTQNCKNKKTTERSVGTQRSSYEETVVAAACWQSGRCRLFQTSSLQLLATGIWPWNCVLRGPLHPEDQNWESLVGPRFLSLAHLDEKAPWQQGGLQSRRCKVGQRATNASIHCYCSDSATTPALWRESTSGAIFVTD